ncbi:peptidyl-prolyl cis-trans isomerase, putative [Ricinus communis]|uniref:Peptidyl-prolyl cis-trans isomerase n=1 Tax=Ricinus communis TaxID=3988 RepID=B9RNC5_RICCO|nr:peptidyl-prolyl cis-trans isomerase, putative [Ricinus communis]
MHSIHGKDQTSSTSATKQKEESTESNKPRYYNPLLINYFIISLFLVFYIQTLVLKGDNAFARTKKSDLPKYAVLNTSKGFITVELFKDGSFDVVDKFIDLCKSGHFKQMPFRHVIKHYVIQAGDADNHGAAEDWTLKGKRYSQLDTSLKHEAFMLGTSKAKHDEKTFELFITTAPIPDLTEKLIVFGRVVKGEDVVQEIEEVDTDEYFKPKSHIKIINVTLKDEI